MATLGRYLKPAGRVAVIDFKEGRSPHMGENYTKAELDGWMTRANFESVGSFDFIEDNFLVIYECRGCSGSAR